MTHRGLTLVEVLAATVLLVIITTTCVPLFRDAIRTARAESTDGLPHDLRLADLAEVADRLLVDPPAFGLPDLHEIDRIELPWPEHPEWPPIEVCRLSGASPSEGTAGADSENDRVHAWLRAQCGPWTVHRWMREADDAVSPLLDGDGVSLPDDAQEDGP